MAKKETTSSKKTKTEAAATKTAKKASKKETKKVATKATKKAEKPKPKKQKKVKEEKPKKVKKEKKETKKKTPKLNSDNDDDNDDDNLLLINTVSSKKETKQQKNKTNQNNSKRRLNLLTLHTPAEGEKRGATARSTSSDNFTSRIARALSQPLFLVGRLRADEKQEDNNNDTSLFLTEAFTVLGSTGNVYTCTIGKFPECSCPDHQKGNVCKHLIFVLHRVLDVPQTSELLPQKAFLRSEVEDMLESGRRKSPKNNYLANEKVRKLLSGDEDDEKNEDAAAEEKEARNKGDSCAVCFEDLEKNLLICSVCRNAVHKTCWNQFQTFNKTNQCILCRGKFLDEKDQASNSASSSSSLGGEGYQNVAGLQSGLLRHRTYNPSSYYSSRSWRRW